MTMSLPSCLKSRKSHALFAPFFFTLLFLPAVGRLQAQGCDPINDTIPPVAICHEVVNVSMSPNDDPNDCYLPDGVKKFGGISWVHTDAFDAGSYDNCGNIHLTLQRVAPYSNCINGLNPVNGHPACDDQSPDIPSEFERAVIESDSIKFYCCEAGSSQTIKLRVYQLDANGNISLNGQGQPIVTACTVTVILEDKIQPSCQAPADVTVACENFDPSLWAYGNATPNDNCCIDTIIKTANYAQFDTVCSKGTLTRTFKAYDCSGNSGSCTQRIVVNYNQYYSVKFPNDLMLTAPSGNNYGEPTMFQEDCELIGVNYTDQVFLVDPLSDIRIERTWTIINWCAFDPNLGFTNIPNPEPNADPLHPANLPGPVVSAMGTPAPWAPTLVAITPGASPTNYSTFWAANTNGYQYTQIIRINETPQGIVTGKVFLDTLVDCSYSTGEPLLQNWKVKVTGLVTGESHETLTDASGIYYQLVSAEDTLVEVTLSVPYNFGQNCPTVYTVVAASGQSTTQDIPVQLDVSCPLLSVDLATPFLRRCFPNTYTVQACNLGTETVNDVSVDVALDTYMNFTSSSIPGTAQGNNTYAFDLGNMSAGACTTFTISFVLDCSATFGLTHCTEAHIFPDTLCDPPSAWSGSNLQVNGLCDGDSVRLTIANTGTGNMNQATDFVVVEDVIMYQAGPVQLNSGESRTFALPASGATWRLEAHQEPNHPWGGIAAAAVEGCGGLNMAGLVNMFALNTSNPFETIDCQENIGAFDPNDKQAIPRGYGDDHLVEANIPLEYMIRFQNTGTDTAFTVVVLDTLSAFLDANTVRSGVASHPYDFALLDGNVLRFRFDHIALPDSNTNEPASHGFIKFQVQQKPDNANGTRIENQAAIYFDFNDPVLTNTTFHTIGDHFIAVSTDDGPAGSDVVRVYPVPANDLVFFEMKQAVQAQFVLTNQFGQVVRTERFSGQQFRFDCGALPSGVYFYELNSSGKKLSTGKIMVR